MTTLPLFSAELSWFPLDKWKALETSKKILFQGLCLSKTDSKIRNTFEVGAYRIAYGINTLKNSQKQAVVEASSVDFKPKTSYDPGL